MNQETILILLSAVTGFIGVPIIQWFKKISGWDDKKALTLTTIVSLVLSLVVVAVNYQASGDPVTIDGVIESMGVVLSTATLFYKFIVSGSKQ